MGYYDNTSRRKQPCPGYTQSDLDKVALPQNYASAADARLEKTSTL